MAKILVHVTHGPEHPTRAALGFMIARCAVEEGHTVSVFLAGDAVQLLRDPSWITWWVSTGRPQVMTSSLRAADAILHPVHNTAASQVDLAGKRGVGDAEGHRSARWNTTGCSPTSHPHLV
jgi:hypothetical protein